MTARSENRLRLRRSGVTVTDRVVRFTFDGRSLEGLAGETVAAALAANGIAAVRRHDVAKDGQVRGWRGLYCGMGACFDCIVTIDGRPGQRACLATLEGGERIRSLAPSATEDDPLEAIVPRPNVAGPRKQDCDILVIGAGPAGLCAARAAAGTGANVTVLDERPQSGGQYFKPVGKSHSVSSPIDAQAARGSALVASARQAGARIIQGADVFGAFSRGEVLALVGGEAAIFRCRKLIIATGAFERAMPVPGWTLPGVMTTGAAQTLSRSYQVAPGSKVVIAGNGPLNLQLATDLLARGVKVAAVVESAAPPMRAGFGAVIGGFSSDPSRMVQGLSYLARTRMAGVPIIWSHVVTSIEGDERAERVTIAPVDREGRPDPSAERIIEADTVCLGYGLIASSEIANALGCRMRLDERHIGSLSVDADEFGRTSVDDVYAVGDGASVAGAGVAQAMGEIAGLHAAKTLGRPEGAGLCRAQARLKRERAFQEALWTIFKSPPVRLDHVADATTLCRCENVSFGRFREEISNGALSLAVIKRRTRLAMGRCQGRYCVPVAAHLLSARTGQNRTADMALAPRLPVKPFPAAALLFEKPEWGGHARAGSPDLSRPPHLPPFDRQEAEILVIGAGVVGACLALELARHGKDVLLVDRDDVNLQASGANAGSLHVQLLSFDFGAKAEASGKPAADTLPLGPYAVGIWQELAETCGGDFEIRITGGLMVAESAAGMDFLKKKMALERQHGIEAHIILANELRDLAPNLSPDLIGAEYCPGEGKINPLSATYSVLAKAEKLGARVLRGTNVERIEREAGHWRVITNRGTLIAGKIINAAGPWAREIGAMVGVDVPVYSAPLQMIVTERAPRLVDQLVAHADRHLSLKQLASGGIVVGGAWTAAYAKHQNMNVTLRESLEGNLWVAERVLPPLSGLHVIRSWAGMNVNIDGAPIIGEVPGRSGFFNAVTSNGYTLAPGVARLTAQLICEKTTEMDIKPYRLERFNGRHA